MEALVSLWVLHIVLLIWSSILLYQTVSPSAIINIPLFNHTSSSMPSPFSQYIADLQPDRTTFNVAAEIFTQTNRIHASHTNMPCEWAVACVWAAGELMNVRTIAAWINQETRCISWMAMEVLKRSYITASQCGRYRLAHRSQNDWWPHCQRWALCAFIF